MKAFKSSKLAGITFLKAISFISTSKCSSTDWELGMCYINQKPSSTLSNLQAGKPPKVLYIKWFGSEPCGIKIVGLVGRGGSQNITQITKSYNHLKK